MSYQALLHTPDQTTILYTGSYADCLEALTQIGQAKGAPNPASIELKWYPDAAKVENTNQLLGRGWWGEERL